MKKRIISAVIAVMVLCSGCGIGKQNSIDIESGSAEESTDVTEETEDVGAEPEDESASTDSVNESEEKSETRGEPITDPEGHYLFNPYLKPKMLADYYTQEEWWDALYNLCDALRKGEDTFECSSPEAYDFATDAAVLGNLFPMGYFISRNGNDGTVPYENGVGRIYYDIPKEEFIKKEQDFEKDVEDILKVCVRTDFSEFEKTLAIFKYISDNFTYNHTMADDPDSLSMEEVDQLYGTYNCLRNRSGICAHIGTVYGYLLNQCGVDAITCEGSGHNWTFLKIDGEYYHSDATWGLKSEMGGSLLLDYFLMSAERRDETHPIDKFETFIPMSRNENFDNSIFKKASNKFDFFKYTSYVSMDVEKNVLTYLDGHGDTIEYKY